MNAIYRITRELAEKTAHVPHVIKIGLTEYVMRWTTDYDPDSGKMTVKGKYEEVVHYPED